MGRFDGKVAIVTGAGRMRGIGRYAALAFAEDGADVVVTGTGRDPSTFPADEQAANWRDVESVAEEIRRMGRRALPLTVDVANAQQVDDMVQRALDELGGADFLVNNASAPRMAAWAPLNELSEEAWRGVLDIKLTGTFFCTRAIAKALMEHGKPGSIVNVISVEAKISRENDIAYATASGALYTFTAKTGRALAPHGIRMNAVSPGTTDTSRNDALYGFPRTDYWRDRTSTIPIGRAGQPEEMGRVIAWLCSKEAEFIVGQCIEMDGGQAA